MATRIFKDIDLSFTPHPTTGDLVAKYDDSAIKNSVKNLIMTMHYERKFHSEIGSSVNALLFDNPNPAMIVLLDREIRDVIQNFEPRVEILDVNIGFVPDYLSVNITIIFKIKNTTRPIVVQFPLKRTR